jgi:flagellar motility protein MotE (MotC chaperone)
MNRNRRIIFLLFINLGLAFLSIYILDMLQIIDYRQIINEVPFMREAPSPKIEDPYLLEKVELEKKWQTLDERVRNFDEEKKKLEEESRAIAIDKENVARDKANVQNMIDNFEKEKSEKESYDKRIDQVTVQYERMPPDDAVKILAKQDDMMVIDVLKRMDEHAQAAGQASPVSHLLSLMDPEQSARIQRKMLQ